MIFIIYYKQKPLNLICGIVIMRILYICERITKKLQYLVLVYIFFNCKFYFSEQN